MVPNRAIRAADPNVVIHHVNTHLCSLLVCSVMPQYGVKTRLYHQITRNVLKALAISAGSTGKRANTGRNMQKLFKGRNFRADPDSALAGWVGGRERSGELKNEDLYRVSWFCLTSGQPVITLGNTWAFEPSRWDLKTGIYFSSHLERCHIAQVKSLPSVWVDSCSGTSLSFSWGELWPFDAIQQIQNHSCHPLEGLAEFCS